MGWLRRHEPLVGWWRYKLTDGTTVELRKDRGRLPWSVKRFDVHVERQDYFQAFSHRRQAERWMRDLGWDGSPPTKSEVHGRAMTGG